MYVYIYIYIYIYNCTPRSLSGLDLRPEHDRLAVRALRQQGPSSEAQPITNIVIVDILIHVIIIISAIIIIIIIIIIIMC